MTIKVGDRVKVEFEGTVTRVADDELRLANNDYDTWVSISDVTVISQPIVLPTGKNALIELEGDIWLQKEVGEWLDSYGSSSWATKDIDVYLGNRPFANYRVIFAGEPD